MSEPIAFLNGDFVPASHAAVSIHDLGLVLGASITEMVRTFHRQPFRLDAHLERMQRSLRAVGFPTQVSLDELRSAVHRLVQHNAALIPSEHDLGIVMFVTAGKNLTYLGGAHREAARQGTVCVHTFPLPFELWSTRLRDGQHLVTPAVRHVPPQSLDPKIKSRSRLHWYLADQQARLVDPSAGSLLLDLDGNITETSTGNFFIVHGNCIQTPAARYALGGVSQAVVRELAEQLGMEYRETQLRLYDVLNADEALTSSTPYCALPVTRINGRTIGPGVPGPVFDRMIGAWSRLVGLDIVAQIEQGAAAREAAAQETA